MKNNPDPQEISSLATLLSQNNYSEAATHAQLLTVRFPLHSFGWMVLGITFSQTGRNTDALAHLKKAAKLSPGDAGVHINLGKVFRDLGHVDEAEVSYRRAIMINPAIAEAHCNLGNVLQILGRLEEAEASLRRALEIKPNFYTAHFNLGNSLYELGRYKEAEASYKRALEINPHHADTHNSLGTTLIKMNRLDEAEACFRKALSINPDYIDVYTNLGGVLNILGKLDDALACYQQQVKLAPDNDYAKHLISALSGETSDRAPNQYVEKIFDNYADNFDTHLQQKLKYEVPQKLVSLLTEHSTPPAEKWNVLDLGCGTGLVGSAIASYTRLMVGVDLSAKMLKKAHARNLYQRLERLEILEMMRAEKSSSYNVIIAADVFIYIGKLDEIVREIKRLVCTGGYLLFSVEDIEMSEKKEVQNSVQREYQLNNSGRYAQSLDYIARLADNNGFINLATVATHIRTEHSRPVNGHLVLWEKVDASLTSP